jgi:hypothetical protein
MNKLNRLMIIVALLVGAGAGSVWDQKYTPTLGEHVYLTLETWYADYGVTVIPGGTDEEPIFEVRIPYKTETRQLANTLKGNFEQRLDRYLLTYWRKTGLTRKHFDIKVVDPFDSDWLPKGN